MKRFFFAFAWICFSTSLILAGTAGYFLVYRPNQLISPIDTATPPVLSQAPEEYKSFSNRGAVKGVESFLETGDGRAKLVAKFLERHDSPLTPYDYWGETLVETADRYGIDFRLLPAIAMQESNLCKRIPEGSFNCLGFGIHERGTLGFDNFESNFDRAARELKAFYIDQGRITPDLIMKKYTPSSNGSWADSVNQWMAEMRYDDRQLGRELDYSANVLEFANEPTPTPKMTTKP